MVNGIGSLFERQDCAQKELYDFTIMTSELCGTAASGLGSESMVSMALSTERLKDILKTEGILGRAKF